MKHPYYVVDAFAEDVFSGNPAGVVPLKCALPAELMQKIAAENNLSETAFVYREGEGYRLRWFTPKAEVDLCGHATLGAAYVLANFLEPDAQMFRFFTKSGELSVSRRGSLFEMDFPSRMPREVPVTAQMERAFGAAPQGAYLARDLMLLFSSAEEVRALAPDDRALSALADFAVIVTAPGSEAEGCDFVSRFFAPNVGVPEDPVTGSAHSTLIPFWAKRLGKTRLNARQLSARGGTLYCEDAGERVKIAGRAALYLKGEITV